MFKQSRPETRQHWVKHSIKEIPEADPKAFCDAAIAKEIPHDHIFRTHTLYSKPIQWLGTRLNCTAEFLDRYQQNHLLWITPEAIFFISPKHYVVVGLNNAIRVELRHNYSIRIHSEANYTDTPPLCRAATAVHILNRMLAGHTPSTASPHCSDCRHFTPLINELGVCKRPQPAIKNQLLSHHRQPRLVPRFPTIQPFHSLNQTIKTIYQATTISTPLTPP